MIVGHSLSAAYYGDHGTNPASVNVKLAAQYGWNVKPGSGYSGVGDPKLAKDIFCFQHITEECSGICAPDNHSKPDCYNRDGMIGQRTLTLLGNEIGSQTALGKVWGQKLNIPSGTRHELCRGVHAEQNAIIQAATAGVSTRGATLYCTHSPCVLCTKLMINSGIVEIVYCHPYRDELASSLIEASEILVREMPVPDLEEMVPDGGSI